MSSDDSAPLTALPIERAGFRGIGVPYQTYQEKRRLNALQRQKAARLQSSNRARVLALEPGQQEDGAGENGLALPDLDSGEAGAAREDPSGLEDADMEPCTSYATYDAAPRGRSQASRGRGPHGSARRRHEQSAGSRGGVRAYGQQYGNELMQPEWMTDVPSDLGTNWLVMPRPEGMRCLIVTSRGRTVSWLRNGAPLHRFHSPLPGGSPATAAGCGGGSASGAGADHCLLDCVFHPPTNTYYVQDLLCWRGYALYDTPAEFRVFWLINKFREEGLMPPPPPCKGTGGVAPAGAGPGSSSQPGAAARPAADDSAVDVVEVAANTDVGMEMMCEGGSGSRRSTQQQHPAPISYRIVPLPVRPCTLQGLAAAYGSVPPPPVAAVVASDTPNPLSDVRLGGSPFGVTSEAAADAAPAAAAHEAATGSEFEFIRDGLYFLHRQGHYCPGPGTTPLALLWKDLGCSRYLIDTDSTGKPLEHQTVVLSYRADRTVATEDEPPVVLGRLPEAFVTAMGDKLKPGRLLRFTIRTGGILFHEGRPAGADLHYEGPANQRRGRADSFSKILFQRLARTAPITAAALAAAAACAEAADAATGAATAPAAAWGSGAGSTVAAAAAIWGVGGGGGVGGDMTVE